MNQNAIKQEIRQQFEVKMYQSARELTELIVDDMIAVFEVDFRDIKVNNKQSVIAMINWD